MTAFTIIYSQRDQRWIAQRLGTVDGSTLGAYGCYITSYADTACYFGHIVTPSELDDLFTNNHWYYNQNNTHDDPANLLADGDLQKAFPDIVYQRSDHYENAPADLTKLQQYVQDPTIVVMISIDMGNGNRHFSPVIDSDGQSKVSIANPWTGQKEDFSQSYGDPKVNILKFVVYKGKAPAQVTQSGANMYNGLDLNNPDSMKPCVDLYNKWKAGGFVERSDVDTICQVLSLPNGQNKDTIVSKINQIKTDSQNTSSALAEALTKYNADEQTISDLTTKFNLDEAAIKALQANPVPVVTTPPVTPTPDPIISAIHAIVYGKWSAFPVPSHTYWVTHLHQIKALFEKKA